MAISMLSIFCCLLAASVDVVCESSKIYLTRYRGLQEGGARSLLMAFQFALICQQIHVLIRIVSYDLMKWIMRSPHSYKVLEDLGETCCKHIAVLATGSVIRPTMSSSEGSSATVCNENGNINIDGTQMAASVKTKIRTNNQGSESWTDETDPVLNLRRAPTKLLKNSKRRRRMGRSTTKSSFNSGSGNGERAQRYHSLRMRASNSPLSGRPASGGAGKKRTSKKPRDAPSSLYKQLKRSEYIYFWM